MPLNIIFTSGVPVAGANAGSKTSISIERYTILSPTTSRILSIIPAVPIVSISLCEVERKP